MLASAIQKAGNGKFGLVVEMAEKNMIYHTLASRINGKSNLEKLWFWLNDFSYFSQSKMNFPRCGWCLLLLFLSCVLQALKARSLLLICSSPQKKTPPSYQYLSGIDNHFKSQSSTVKNRISLVKSLKIYSIFCPTVPFPLPVPSRSRNRLIEKDHITRMQTKVLVCLNSGVEIGNLCWIFRVIHFLLDHILLQTSSGGITPKKENTDACCSARNDLWRLLWKHRFDLSDDWDE